MVDVDKAIIARLKTSGKNFEILVDCNEALKFKQGVISEISDVLADEKVFSDSKKGLLASEHEMQSLFSTTNPLEVAKIIIQKGEIQLTSEYKSKLREEKRKKILNLIHQNAADPKTHLPHPQQRLELAFQEANVKIDEFKSAEEQVDEIIKQLRPIIPISVEKKEIRIKIPGQYAGKCYRIVQGYSKIKREDWLNDGSWQGEIEIAVGLQSTLFDELNNITHGNVESEILEIKK